MPRRKCCRRVMNEPTCTLFKPAGIPARMLEQVSLTVDELEALRLADYEGLYHEQAAGMMNVSRQTFGRIVSEARSKVATALIEDKALKIGGGVFEVDDNECPMPEHVGQRAGRRGCVHKSGHDAGTGDLARQNEKLKAGAAEPEEQVIK